MMSRPAIRVLLIEDSPTDAELICIGLEDVRTADFQIDAAETLADGLERLQGSAFDVVLVDLSLPDCAGIETCVRVHDRHPDVPLIVLTGLDDEETALEAMKVGAQDYLVKRADRRRTAVAIDPVFDRAAAFGRRAAQVRRADAAADRAASRSAVDNRL